MRLPLPNFLVIGAAKCGTTALYDALKQHPDIFMPQRKEPVYLLFSGERPKYPDLYGQRIASSPIRDLGSYMELFAAAKTEHAIGEATPLYLESPVAARRIRELMPKAKLIAVLRQPADRAYSQFCALTNMSIEQAPSLDAAIDDEPRREAAGWYPGQLYIHSGRYHKHLSVYYDLFPREQIKVYLYDDWKGSPGALLRDIFSFLGIDPDFQPEIHKVNVSSVPLNREFTNVLRRLQRTYRHVSPSEVDPQVPPLLQQLNAIHKQINEVPPPPFDPATRRRLTEVLREDIIALQDLINRDLSHWL